MVGPLGDTIQYPVPPETILVTEVGNYPPSQSNVHSHATADDATMVNCVAAMYRGASVGGCPHLISIKLCRPLVSWNIR